MFTNAIIRKIAGIAIDKTIDGVVALIKSEEEFIENTQDVNDPYFEGYTDALDIIASAINCIKSKEK